MMWWSLFGMLSSSCCAVQLILNLFNFGCAGFNTYLGPIRPAFLAMTIILNGRMWQLAMPNIGLPSTPEYYLHSLIASTALAVFLSLLPELTELRNKRKTSLHTKLSNLAISSGKTITEVKLALDGLGCVACISAVQGALQNIDQVASCEIALEKKEATIVLICDEAEARDSLVPDIITRIENIGFEASLQNMQKADPVSIDSALNRDGKNGHNPTGQEPEEAQTLREADSKRLPAAKRAKTTGLDKEATACRD